MSIHLFIHRSISETKTEETPAAAETEQPKTEETKTEEPPAEGEGEPKTTGGEGEVTEETPAGKCIPIDYMIKWFL